MPRALRRGSRPGAPWLHPGDLIRLRLARAAYLAMFIVGRLLFALAPLAMAGLAIGRPGPLLLLTRRSRQFRRALLAPFN